jgi:SAM-dependent methyltransferase
MERFRNTGQPDWDWWGRLWPAPGETLRRLGIEPDTSVAEVGCGNGYFALPAAHLVAPAPVYAVDLDEALLAELQHLADRQALDNLRTLHGDARNLSRLLPEAVDAVVLANAFHGVDDRPALVREVADALAPGGSFVVVNWHDRPRAETTVAGEARGPPTDLRLSPAETERQVTEAGPFALARQVDLPPYHYGLVFRRSD